MNVKDLDRYQIIGKFCETLQSSAQFVRPDYRDYNTFELVGFDTFNFGNVFFSLPQLVTSSRRSA